MELKQLISKFTYRIEAKPGGGFIAHPSDPTVAPLEAATREELQQKIRTTIIESLGTQFPGLKPAMEGQQANLNFHVEHKPGGGYIVHSADAQSEPIEFGTHNDLESHLAEKFVNFVGKRLAPELAEQLAAQGGSGDINVVVNKRVGLSVKAGSRMFTAGIGHGEGAAPQLNDGKTVEANGAEGLVSNAPINPEQSGKSGMLLFVLFLVSVAVIVYFLLNR